MATAMSLLAWSDRLESLRVLKEHLAWLDTASEKLLCAYFIALILVLQIDEFGGLFLRIR